ncbi:MAG: COX15/CtaA family protein [Alphaproteobacteria bacterium]|nr:COX15/CtaA family protein [Alphaproteobacteria bacterium]
MSHADAANVRSPMVPARGVVALRAWLLVVAGLVYATILVGGATRLTDSGLSITEWRPLLGAVPPLSDADWVEAFGKYQSMTAQFHLVNSDMTLEGFKSIYWWEWAHRQLGRVIGVVFLAPFLVFLAMRIIPRSLLPHLAALFCLGGLQGVIGWWMVASGVNSDLTSVAPYRLMVHFSLALLIIAWSFWLWLELGDRRRVADDATGGWAVALLWVSAIQMMLGALVAGLDAGRGYTDWPMMAGRLVPEAMWALDPWQRNLFENEATTQFLHRMTAYGLLALALAAAWRFRRVRGVEFGTFAALTLGQGALGVVTLLSAAPLPLALAHQALGTVLLLAAVRLVWCTRTLNSRASGAVSGDVDKPRTRL